VIVRDASAAIELLPLPAFDAARENATAYDAAYLVPAEALGATLVTCDTALGSIPGDRARVEVIR